MLRPRSRTQDLCALAEPWQQVLGEIATRYRLLFLGYGGNDLGFMKFLADGLAPGRCAFEPMWGFFSPNPQAEEQQSLPANPLVHRFLQNQGGALFPVPSFDVVMRAVLEETGTPPPTAEDVKVRTEEIVAVFRSGQESAEHEWRAISLDKTVGQMSQAIPPVMSVEETNRDVDGFDWRIRARAAATTDEAIALYKEALRRTPDDLDLIVAYATYLHRHDVQYDDAEMLYRRAFDQTKATAVKREHAWWIGNYALFLEKARKDLDLAEALYRRALNADSKRASHLGNYARFLKNERRNFDLAEEYFGRAVEADPKNANLLGAFAVFLENQRKDFDRAEEYYRCAVEADPKHASNLGNYADFLEQRRKDFDRAEDFYQRAVETDPKHAGNLGFYALFLQNQRKDFDRAEKYYQLALEADPKHANNLGYYALFLQNQRKDFDQAKQFYQRAVEADPKHANNLGNYAFFLHNQRKDFDSAEEHYQRAIDADPKHANNLGNYAVFLQIQRKDLDRAEEFYRRAVEADPKYAEHLGNYAAFLWKCVNKPDLAALRFAELEQLDGLSADALFYCSVFCQLQLKDPSRAEALYNRALAVDDRHAASLANSIQLLLVRGEEKVARERLALLDSIPEVPEDVQLDAAFYRLAHFAESWPTGLKLVKDWVTRGVRSEGWDFSPNLQRAAVTGHANLPLLEALARVITAGADPAILDAFPEWQAA
jgi:Tfp pilus assembly protein PilF